MKKNAQPIPFYQFLLGLLLGVCLLNQVPPQQPLEVLLTALPGQF